MPYQPISLQQEIAVKKIYTIHYFEYRNDFHFSGERHDFWEFCYVDKGEVLITGGEKEYILKKGEIVFHKPNEFHSVTATGYSAPNLAVVSFQCVGEAMCFFEDKILHVDNIERNLLAQIILEAKNCFAHRLDNPYQTKMVKKESVPFGSEQFLRLYLEQFLLHIIRRNTFAPQIYHRIEKTSKNKGDAENFQRLVLYLEKHISEQLTVDQICRDNTVSRSQLQTLFRAQCGHSVMDFFANLKIDAAKEMIRMNDMNFTQIAEKLGYTSIHYFSRQFKKITAMTPTEYAYSIKILAEGKFEQ